MSNVITTYQTSLDLATNHDEVCAQMKEFFQDIGTSSRPLGTNTRLRNVNVIAGHVYIETTDPIATSDLAYYGLEKVSI